MVKVTGVEMRLFSGPLVWSQSGQSGQWSNLFGTVQMNDSLEVPEAYLLFRKVQGTQVHSVLSGLFLLLIGLGRCSRVSEGRWVPIGNPQADLPLCYMCL